MQNIFPLITQGEIVGGCEDAGEQRNRGWGGQGEALCFQSDRAHVKAACMGCPETSLLGKEVELWALWSLPQNPAASNQDAFLDTALGQGHLCSQTAYSSAEKISLKCINQGITTAMWRQPLWSSPSVWVENLPLLSLAVLSRGMATKYFQFCPHRADT